MSTGIHLPEKRRIYEIIQRVRRNRVFSADQQQPAAVGLRIHRKTTAAGGCSGKVGFWGFLKIKFFF